VTTHDANLPLCRQSVTKTSFVACLKRLEFPVRICLDAYITRGHHNFHRLAAIFVVTASLLPLAACVGYLTDDASSPPTPQPVAAVQRDPLRLDWPPDQPVTQTPWVMSRLAAVKQVYGFTSTGESWIDGYDFRQMQDQPAWFGSNGYSSWAGAGEAVPRSILHELGHSYWGAFAVDGRPELSWQSDSGTSDALQAYRNDLRTFVTQPPDRFEPLRDRFRNLPNLDVGEYPDLFHFGEADLLYMTGGNLALVPPILRKYVSGYLELSGVGPSDGVVLESWDVAIAWFNGLSPENRRVAGELFGLQHFPAELYRNLPQADVAGLDKRIRTVYETEEKQRLIDFADQFDGVMSREFSLVDAAGADRGFDFWRSYLSDKLELHARYPDVLRDVGSKRAKQLADALDFYHSIDGFSGQTQVQWFNQHQNEPLVPELAVLLAPRAIVQLFAEHPSTDEGGIAAVLGGRAERLASLLDAVGKIEAAPSTASAAHELESFITRLPEDQLRSDVYLLFDLLRSASDGGLASRVLPALNDNALRLLLRVALAAARSREIGPDRLLEAVGITDLSSIGMVRAGSQQLAVNSSGNFAIDAPYDAAVYAHLDRFVEYAPADVLSTVANSGMRFLPWIERDGGAAQRVLGANPRASAATLLRLAGSNETPWRVVHLLPKTDPELAAEITVEMRRMDQTGSSEISRMLREFAYDSYWSDRRSGPNVHPSRFASFVVALVDVIGEQEVADALREVNALVFADIASGEIEREVESEFRATIAEAIDSVSGSAATTVRSVATQAGLAD
jgi:hypothetical protein